jgi:DNA repair photolyase
MSKTLKILSRPRGNAEEYGRWSVNPYIGCSHGCLYCYLKKGPSGAYLGQDKPVLKKGVVSEEHAYHLAMAEIIEHRDEIIRDGGLFMTFTSDPCAEETRELFFRIIGSCIGDGCTPKEKVVPVTLLTKNADFCGYDIDVVDTREKARRINAWISNIAMFNAELLRDRLAIGFTLTGHDELEPNASPNAERIKAMHYLAKNGYNVWASIEPVIDFDSSYQMIADAVAAGCRHFKIGLLTNNTRVVRKDFEFGEHHFKAYRRDEAMQFVGYVMEMTQGLATVYWKQSFVDFFGDEPVHGMTAQEFLHQWPHSVGKDWSMFNNKD